MAKVINIGKPQKQLQGVHKVVDVMAITIGPRGRNVSLTNGDTVNDGRRIAEDITGFKDALESKGATKVRNLVRKVSSDVGGGRTATAIMYRELIQTGTNLLDRGFNANLIKKGMNMAVKDIHTQLDKMSQPVKGRLKEIATISTEDEELGKIVAETIEKVGLESVVTVEESQSFGITSEIAEGLKFDKGWASPFMVTNRDRMESEMKDCNVIIMDRKLSVFTEIQPYLDALLKKGKKDLFIIAEDFDETVLRAFAFARYNGLFNVLAIKTPGVGDNKKFCIEDLCALTGAEVWQENTPPVLGKAKKILSKKDSTIIIGGDVKTWITTLKTRLELAENPWEKDQYNERIAKLTDGIAVIKVGASSEDDVKYLKLKLEDGINETKRALEEGIVAGGNVSFLNAAKNIKFQFTEDTPEDVRRGYQIVLDSIEAPLRQIVENGGGKPDVVIAHIYSDKSLTIGYNSLDDEVVDDMYAIGIIDATKVVKTVLQYAVNEAILFLSIGGDISEEPIETK